MASTGQLIATITPNNATNKNVTWSSSNPAVATVEANGLVVPKGVGSCVITGTTQDGGFTDTSNVTVVNEIIPVMGVTLNKASSSLRVGQSETLAATITPADATDKGVTWNSSNPGVASVDQNGKVTAIAAGSATITVTTQDGNKTASCAYSITLPTVLPTSITADKERWSFTYEEPATFGGGTVSFTMSPSNASTSCTATVNGESVGTNVIGNQVHVWATGNSQNNIVSVRTSNDLYASCTVDFYDDTEYA